MKKFWLALALCLTVGCVDGDQPSVGWTIGTRTNRPIEVKIVNAPNEAQIKNLESRLNQLEEWASRQGRKFK